MTQDSGKTGSFPTQWDLNLQLSISKETALTLQAR